MALDGADAGTPRLTAREQQVLLAVADRLTNSEIAEQFGLSKRTVEAHLSSLYVKTGVATRRELIAVGRGREPQAPPGDSIGPAPSTRRGISWRVAHKLIDQRIQLTQLHLDRSREQAARARGHVRKVSRRHETS